MAKLPHPAPAEHASMRAPVTLETPCSDMHLSPSRAQGALPSPPRGSHQRHGMMTLTPSAATPSSSVTVLAAPRTSTTNPSLKGSERFPGRLPSALRCLISRSVGCSSCGRGGPAGSREEVLVDAALGIKYEMMCRRWCGCHEGAARRSANVERPSCIDGPTRRVIDVPVQISATHERDNAKGRSRVPTTQCCADCAPYTTASNLNLLPSSA